MDLRIPLLVGLLAVGCRRSDEPMVADLPDDTGGPAFVINGPLPDSTTAGSFWLSVQPTTHRSIARVDFWAAGEPLADDTDGSDGWRRIVDASDLPEGLVELAVAVTGDDGAVSTRRITVTNVPDPGPRATVGASGAVLGAPDGSVVVVPPGVATGQELRLTAWDQDRFEDALALDLDALGIIFLGGQALDGDEPLDGPVSTFASNPGAAPLGERLAQFTVLPDLDGDGQPQIVQLRGASFTPDGGLLTDPLPVPALGDVVRVPGTRSVAAGSLSVMPGQLLVAEVYGFQPNAVIPAASVWTSGQVSRVSTGKVLPNLQGPGQVFLTVCPGDLPTGQATVELTQRAPDGALINQVTVGVEVTPRIILSSPPGEVATEAMEELDEVIEGNAPGAGPAGVAEAIAALWNQTKEKKKEADEALQDAKDRGDEEMLRHSDEILGNVGPPLPPGADCMSVADYDQTILRALDLYHLGELVAPFNPVGAAIFQSMANSMDQWAAMNANNGLLCEQQAGVDSPEVPKPKLPPAPSDGGGGASGVVAVCAVPVQGGDGGGAPTPPGGGGPRSALASLAGRIVVRVNSGGPIASTGGVSDAFGYVYVPSIPEGLPFVATAYDTVTRRSATFEAIGPAEGDSIFMYFDFDAPQEVCAPPDGYDATWRGFVSDAWNEPENWAPAGIPAATDAVWICPDAVARPRLDADAVVGDLLVPDGATLMVGSRTLTVRGRLDATGGIEGVRAVVLEGTHVQGTVDNLEVHEAAVLSGDTTVVEALRIVEPAGAADGDASLELAGHTLQTGIFRCCDGGAVGLVMTDPADRFVGSSFVDIETHPGPLEEGELEIGGDLVLCGEGFSVSGAVLRMAGSGLQSIRPDPGCGRATGATFGAIHVAPGADASLEVTSTIDGGLLVEQGGTLTIRGGTRLIWTVVSGEIDLSGTLVVRLSSNNRLAGVQALRLHATGVLDDEGDIEPIPVCDPKDGVIVDADPCP